MREENYYNGKGNNSALLIIIVLLVLVVLGLVGFIIYDKVTTKTNEPSVEENEPNNNLEDNFNEETKLTESDKISYNKKLKTIWFSLYRVLGENGNLDFDKLKSGENLIETKNDKMEFLWELISRDKNMDKTKDVSGTGSISIGVSDFIEKYKEVYNEDITKKDISNSYTVKNEIVYGNYYTGFVNEFAIKTDKITKKNNHIYQLETSLITLESDVEAFESCSAESVTTCSKNVIYGNLLIEYGSLEDNNYLISITFEK